MVVSISSIHVQINRFTILAEKEVQLSVDRTVEARNGKAVLVQLRNTRQRRPIWLLR
jgi:hypothetical protein